MFCLLSTSIQWFTCPFRRVAVLRIQILSNIIEFSWFNQLASWFLLVHCKELPLHVLRTEHLAGKASRLHGGYRCRLSGRCGHVMTDRIWQYLTNIEYRHIKWSLAIGYELTSLTGQGGFPLWHVWESLQPQVFWFLRVAEVANAMAVQSGLEFLDSASLHILTSCCMDSWGLRFPARAVLGAQRPVLHLLGGGVGEIKRC